MDVQEYKAEIAVVEPNQITDVENDPLEPLVVESHRNSTGMWDELRKTLDEYRDVFALQGDATNHVQHRVEIVDPAPIKQCLRRVPMLTTQIAEAEIQKMLERGVIKLSDSLWASPIVLVKKKDGTKCFCVDFCKVNAVSKKDAYPHHESMNVLMH